MENKKLNLLKPLSWVFILLAFRRLQAILVSILFYIFRYIEPAKSRMFLCNGLSKLILATILIIGYLTITQQSIFQKNNISSKATFFLMFTCLCLYFIIEGILTTIWVCVHYSTSNFIERFEWYKYMSSTDDFFKQFYFVKFYIFDVLIVAPISEEIIYRRVIYDSMKRQSHSVSVAIIFSSAIFALVHFRMGEYNLYSNIRQCVFAFLLASILSYCYEKTGRILPSILIHFTVNGCAVLHNYIRGIYSFICTMFLFMFGLSIVLYLFIRYLVKLKKKPVSPVHISQQPEVYMELSATSSNNCPKLFSRLKSKALLPILFLSCLFESLIVMQTIIMIFRLSVDYKIVWYASIQLAFFVVAVLYVRDCHVSLSDVLVKKSVNLNWSLIVKFLCATFVLCFVFFYLPNVSRFGSVISFFKNNNAVLDLSIFNFSDSSPIAFIIFIFIAPIIEQMIFKFGVHHFAKSKSRIIPIAMFVSFVVFGLLYTLRLRFTLTELTVIFCVKFFLLYAYKKSESILTCVVLQFFITVILFLNRYLFFVYSMPLFSALASVGVLVLGFTVMDFLRRRKLDE